MYYPLEVLPVYYIVSKTCVQCLVAVGKKMKIRTGTLLLLYALRTLPEGGWLLTTSECRNPAWDVFGFVDILFFSVLLPLGRDTLQPSLACPF